MMVGRQMERSEPVLVPEWYRTGGVGSSSNSYRHYPPSSSSLDRSSNYSHHRRCANGSMAYDKYTSTRSRTYGNINNRGYHYRSHEKNLDYSDRKGSILTDNGYCYCSDISSSCRNEKDSLLLSQTMVPGRPLESMLKRHVNGLNNGGFPGNSAKGIQNSSFDKDFRSLGSVSVAPSTKNSFNMAEALAKPPLRTRTFQSPVNTQKLEGLATKQSRQLITLATPKVPVWSKAKGTRTASMILLPKLVPQSSSQSDKNPNLANPKSDVTKAYNDANFLVLNREKDVSVPSFDKITCPMSTNKVVNPVTAASDSPPHKLNMEMIQSSTTKKRHFSQDRIRFFNTIRNCSSANNSSSASQKHNPVNSHSALNKSGDHAVIANASTSQLKEPSMFDSSSGSSMININGLNRKFNSLVDHENVAKVEENASCLDYPNEEEKNFLKSLGWQEDGGDDDALTAEEIDAFIREYKLGHLLKTDV